jgi:hypothetical protein
MNFDDFDIEKSKMYFETNAFFDIMLHDGTVHNHVVLFSFDGEKLKTVYKFSNLDGDFWETSKVKMIRFNEEQ